MSWGTSTSIYSRGCSKKSVVLGLQGLMLPVSTYSKAMFGWHDIRCLIRCIAGAFAIADEKKPRVVTLEFPAPPSGPGSAEKLGEHGTYYPWLRILSSMLTTESDAFLASILDWLPSPEYTVIYTTTPSTSRPQPSITESEPYEMDTTFGSPVHMDLKRDFTSHRRASSNVTLPAGPLFERYQFFNPGKLDCPIPSPMDFGLLTYADRVVHGFHCCTCTIVNTLRCNFGCCKFASFLCCV